MSFFDEVETTVANTRYLQAVEENAPVKLELAHYEDLADLDNKLHHSLTIHALLKPKTIGFYQFSRYLREYGYKEVVAFLEAVHELQSVDSDEALAKARKIYDDYLYLKSRKTKLAPPIKEAEKPAEKVVETTQTSKKKSDAKDQEQDKGAEKDEKKDSEKEEKREDKVDGEEGNKNKDKEEVEDKKDGKSEANENNKEKEKEGNGNEEAAPGETDAEKADKDKDKDPTHLTEEELAAENKKFISALLDHVPSLLDPVEAILLTGQSTSKVRGMFEGIIAALKDFLDPELPRFLKTEHWRRYVQVEHYARQPLKLNDVRIFRVLGRGAFGAVSAVQKVDTHAIFAMKEMGKKQVKSSQSEWMVINERRVLAAMRSPFVLNLKYSFHNEESLFLVFDMCAGGDLKFHLRNMGTTRTGFEPERALFYSAEVLLGLEHIHSHNIVYRDLKPNNILLDTDGHVKISDLGLAIRLKKNKVLKHLAGTAGYWAPEIVAKTGTYKASDFWSFGVFLYEMLAGRRPSCRCGRKTKEWCPFGQQPEMEKNALEPDGILLVKVDYPPDKFSPDAIDLLEKLFEVDPNKRLGANSAQEIKEHKYYASIDWAKLEMQHVKPPWKPEARTVHANSIGEVGEFNKNKFKKMKLTPEDEKNYEDFTFISEEGVQEELGLALYKQDHPPDPTDHPAPPPPGCCSIL